MVRGGIVPGRVGGRGAVSHGNGWRLRVGLGALWGMGGVAVEVGVGGSMNLCL